MFGPALKTVFASRWRAVWFCCSMLLLAYCSVPAPDDATTANATAADTQTARDALAASGLSKEEKAQLKQTIDNLDSLSK